MKILNTIIITILLAVSGLTASAETNSSRSALLEKYKSRLPAAKSARDSIKIMYTIYDLSDRAAQRETAWQIYDVAGRAEDLTVQNDMLRNLATFYHSNDSVIAVLMELADKIPNEAARSATKTFIFNQQISRKSRNPGDKSLETMLLDSIKNSHQLEGNDIYDKIALLYQIIQYLGVDAEGTLFRECLDRYADLMESLPASDYPLKNQFYTTAAMVYSRLNGDSKKAVEYDRKLLEIMSQLQLMYNKKGRKFRNYDINKFISYRRILSNFECLSPEEIDEVHDSIMALYNRDSDVRRIMDSNGQAFAFHYMAIQDYEKAIPAIKGILKNIDLSAYQRQKYYGMLIKAAKETGDKDTYVSSMENFIKNSLKIDSLRKVTMKREIMLRNNIIDKPLLYNETEEQRQMDTTSKGKVVAMYAVSSILAILLILYATLYFRLRSKRYSR